MKTTIRTLINDGLFAALFVTLSLSLFFAGCKSPSTPGAIATDTAVAAALVSTTAQKVANVNTAIPASVKQDIINLVTAHPELKSVLESAANAVESVAPIAGKVISYAQIVDAVAEWVPQTTVIATGLASILAAASNAVALDGPAVTEIGELIKSYA